MNHTYTERVELAVHTTMGVNGGVATVEEIVKYAIENQMPAVAFLDNGSTASYPIVWEYCEFENIKPIFGIEAYVGADVDDFEEINEDAPGSDDEDPELPDFHISVLAQNQDGVRTLYKLLSDADYGKSANVPLIKMSEILKKRENLILGSGGVEGLLGMAILCEAPEEDLVNIGSAFDYFEVQPPSELMWLAESDDFTGFDSEADIYRFIESIIELGAKMGKPVVATGDVHYLRPHNSLSKGVLQNRFGFDIVEKAQLYFRTTQEMVDEFAFLGGDKAYEIVVENSNLIARRTEWIKPIEPEHAHYGKEGDFERLKEICLQRLEEIYGSEALLPINERKTKWDVLQNRMGERKTSKSPDLTQDKSRDLTQGEAKHADDNSDSESRAYRAGNRLKKELNIIERNGNAYLYLFYYELIHRLELSPAQYHTRGTAAGMLVCYLLGISHSDPLDPEVPLYSEFFVELKGDKHPDIDLNMDGEVLGEAYELIKSLPGVKTAYRAAVPHLMSELLLDHYINDYEERLEPLSEVEKAVIKHDLCFVNTGWELRPGMLLIPEGMDETDFTVVGMDFMLEERILCRDCLELNEYLEQIDLIGNKTVTLVAKMYELTGVYPTEEEIRSEEILSLFTSAEGLGIDDDPELMPRNGLLGVPGWRSFFVLDMVEKLKPKTIADLIKIEIMSHGTSTWFGNGDILVQEKNVPLQDLIGSREDVYEMLLTHGVDRVSAFRIAENVRKGKLASGRMPKELVSILENSDVPEWFKWSCAHVKYLFQRAYGAESMQSELRALYYKLHYPELYYPTYLKIYGSSVFHLFFDQGDVGFEKLRMFVEEEDAKVNDNKYLFLVWREMRQRLKETLE